MNFGTCVTAQREFFPCHEFGTSREVIFVLAIHDMGGKFAHKKGLP